VQLDSAAEKSKRFFGEELLKFIPSRRVEDHTPKHKLGAIMDYAPMFF
jgi:hypothetical protein